MFIAPELNKLVGTFSRDLALAKDLESPNPEDDRSIRLAIIGFSYNSPAHEWDRGHYNYVRTKLDQEYNDEEIQQYGENGINVRLFAALGIGLLLGLYQQGEISGAEFRIGEFLIPGLIMGHLPEITSTSVPTGDGTAS